MLIPTSHSLYVGPRLQTRSSPMDLERSQRGQGLVEQSFLHLLLMRHLLSFASCFTKITDKLNVKSHKWSDRFNHLCVVPESLSIIFPS